MAFHLTSEKALNSYLCLLGMYSNSSSYLSEQLRPSLGSNALERASLEIFGNLHVEQGVRALHPRVKILIPGLGAIGVFH